MTTMLTIACLLVLGTLGSGDTLPDRLQALKFADNKDSYISFVPGMAISQITHKASVCVWLKNPGASKYAVVFTYGGNNFRLSGNSYYNYVAKSGYFPTTTPSRVTAVLAEWHHVCLTFSAASNMARYYVNGEQVASKSAPDTISYGTSYKVTVGNYSPGYRNYYGGEVTDLNVYSKTLSKEEVQEKYRAGMCFEERGSQEDSIVLSWEDILKQPRNGSVTDFIPEPCIKVLLTGYNQLKNLTTTQRQKNEELRDQVTSLSGQVTTQSRTIEDLQETNKELEGNITTQYQTIEDLRDSVTTQNKNNEDLRDHVTTQNKNIEDLRDHVTTQNKNIGDLRDHVTTQNQTIKDLKETNEELEGNVTDQIQTIEDLRGQVTTLKETNEDLIEEVTTLRKCQMKKCKAKESRKKKGMPEALEE